MAIQPKTYSSKEFLQPGARGERFIQTLPGYREEEERINRTNTHLNSSQHDVPNCKWDFDYRLPILFRYGFAYGFNQIVIPKGRVVALDPNMNMVDFETKIQHNTLTLANGGVPVRLRTESDKYPTISDGKKVFSQECSTKTVHGVGKEWVPAVGIDKAYTDRCYRSFPKDASAASGDSPVELNTEAEALAALTAKVDEKTGKVVDSSSNAVKDNIRVGNIPIGILQRNEYTRDEDSYNGIMPGPVLTDAMIEMPWFAYKDKAEENFWGSAYGNLFPGALVKADENGRITVSPLSFDEELKNMGAMEMEKERRQVIGEVYSATKELLPEGAAKWAIWALEDRLGFEEFNPDEYRQTNRRGEDTINHSPYKSTGEYPGYPYDPAFTSNDLHMINDSLRKDNYDLRMDQKYQYSNLGIPGLTDGYNAVTREIPEYTANVILKAQEGQTYIDRVIRLSEVNIEKGTLQIKLGDESYVAAVEGQNLESTGGFKINYVDEMQGLVGIAIDTEKANAYFGTKSTDRLEVKVKFNKRGLAGVPTFMDWDGCVGSVKILLQK